MLSMLPNPFTPMAFIPPDIARQLTISYYITVAALVVIVQTCRDNEILKLYSDHALGHAEHNIGRL